MPVTLSIKNVPDAVARKLKARAKRNHRSLQGELLALVEGAIHAPAETRPASFEALKADIAQGLADIEQDWTIGAEEVFHALRAKIAAHPRRAKIAETRRRAIRG